MVCKTKHVLGHDESLLSRTLEIESLKVGVFLYQDTLGMDARKLKEAEGVVLRCSFNIVSKGCLMVRLDKDSLQVDHTQIEEG